MARLIMMTDFSESYAMQLLRGIMRYSQEHDPWVVSRMPLSMRDNGRLEEVARFAADWRADAVIGQFRVTDRLELFSRQGIIPIAQDYVQPFPGVVNIRGDYVRSGEMAADFFIGKGIRNFAFYGVKGMVWSDERCRAFQERVLSQLGDAFFSAFELTDPSDAWWYDTSETLSWLEQLPKPVAIFACDDNRAYQVVEAVHQSRREDMHIPEDILVMGVDNDEPLCTLCTPQLTSVNQDTESAGYRTAALLDELLQLPPEKRPEHYRDITVPATYITPRRSTEAFIHRNPHVSRIMYYVNANLGNPIRVDDLVKQVPMSRRMLETLFLRETGISLYQYVIHARVNRMKELIHSGRSPVQAADDLGTEYKIIARNFKLLTGMTPAEYAKEQRR